uniref:N-acetyltransferase domain-containing protein n=2 Tax=Panagrellus redivivus TaxID=6233 RepID=A0A7E4W5G1_PANRE
MSIRLVPPSEFSSLLSTLAVHLPATQLIHPIVKFEVDGFNAGTILHVYEYSMDENAQTAKFYLACKYHEHTMTIFVGNSTVLDDDFEASAMAALFPVLWERIEPEEAVEVIIPEAADVEFHNQLKLRNITRPIRCHAKAFMYYMSPEKVKTLLKIDPVVPDGFVLKPLQLEHAEILISLLLHGVDGDTEQAALRIRQLPSVGIFEAATDKLVAFEYNDGLGMIAHQYVYPEYRGKGLGSAVETVICQENAKVLGIWPTKAVAQLRPKVVRITERNPLWMKLLRPDGSHQLFVWNILTRNVQPPIEFYDN